MQKNTETEMLIITNTDTIIIVGIFFIATKIKKYSETLFKASEYYIFFNNKNTICTNIIYAFFSSMTTISPGHPSLNGTKPPTPQLTLMARLPSV